MFAKNSYVLLGSRLTAPNILGSGPAKINANMITLRWSLWSQSESWKPSGASGISYLSHKGDAAAAAGNRHQVFKVKRPLETKRFVVLAAEADYCRGEEPYANISSASNAANLSISVSSKTTLVTACDDIDYYIAGH